MVLQIDFKIALRNFVSFLRPAFAVVVGIFEHEMPQRIHAVIRSTVRRFHAADIVGIVIIKNVYPAIRRFIKHGICGLNAVGRFEFAPIDPGFPLVLTAHRHYDFALHPLVRGARGNRHEPRAVDRIDNVRLIGITDRRYDVAVYKISPVENLNAFPHRRIVKHLLRFRRILLFLFHCVYPPNSIRILVS